MLTLTMPNPRRRTCQVCHRRDDVVGAISWRGKCISCAKALSEANNDSIHEGHGEGHARRLEGYARKLYGPRVALALKQAGVFDPEHVDTRSPSP